MGDSMAEHLRQEMACEGLLECIHGLKRIDAECFRVLAESDEPLTIDEVADRVDRERSTAYRSVQRLLQSGFVEQEQHNYDGGGYYHVYSTVEPEQIARDMQRRVNDWYAKMARLVREFEREYADPEPEPPSATE